LWYLKTFDHCVVCPCSTYASDYPCGILNLLVIVLSVNDQKFENTSGVIRGRKSYKDRQHNDQKFEDTTGVIRGRKSNKDRQDNDQKFEDTTGVIGDRTSNKDRQDNDQKFEDTIGVMITPEVFSNF
jgi:hypothetical protein